MTVSAGAKPPALGSASASPGLKASWKSQAGNPAADRICATASTPLLSRVSGIIADLLTRSGEADYVCFAGGAHARTLEMHTPYRHGPAMPYMPEIRELRRALNGVPLMALGRITDPAEADLPGPGVLGGPLDWVSGEVYPASIDDPTACDRFVLR